MSDANLSTSPTSTPTFAPTYTVPLYQAIAQKLQAAANCECNRERSWPPDVEHWHNMAAAHRDAAIALVREHMPHGSGIDSGVTLDLDASTEVRLVFTIPYHHMDGNGSYCGWVDSALRLQVDPYARATRGLATAHASLQPTLSTSNA